MKQTGKTKTAPLIALPEVAAAASGTIQWRDELRIPHAEAIGPALLGRELHRAELSRTTNRYPHKRSYTGLHHFASTGQHVRHESMLEAEALAWLDMFSSIVEIAAQPMKITFADGSVHFPDYFALHDDQRQVLYDVKPSRRITPKYESQFAKTRAVCERIGWGYEVYSEQPPQVKFNLDLVSAFRDHRYQLDAEQSDALQQLLVTPMSLNAAVSALNVPLPEARAGIFHAIWALNARIDLTRRITGHTLIERNDYAHA